MDYIKQLTEAYNEFTKGKGPTILNIRVGRDLYDHFANNIGPKPDNYVYCFRNGHMQLDESLGPSEFIIENK